MPYVASELEHDIKSVLNDFFTPNVDQEFTLHICRQTAIALDQLYRGYDHNYMPDKLQGALSLSNIYHQVQFNYRLSYIRGLPKQEMIDILSNAVRDAFVALNHEAALILPFISNRINTWLSVFVEQLQKPELELDYIMNNLSALIATEFAQNILLFAYHDVYDQFHTELKTRLFTIKEHIDANANIDEFKSKVNKHATRSFATIPSMKNSIADETHPHNVVRKIHFALMIAVMHNIQRDNLQRVLAGVMPRLMIQHAQLDGLHAGLPPQVIINTMRNAFVNRMKISNYLQDVSTKFAVRVLFTWIHDNHCDPVSDAILLYENELAVKRASAQVHHALMGEVDKYLKFPERLEHLAPPRSDNTSPALSV